MVPFRRPAALLALAVVLGLTACGASSSGRPSTGTTPARCPASAGLPSNVSDHGVAATSGSPPAIEAGDFFFKVTCVTGVPSGTVALTVHNAGQALHNVSIPSLTIDEDVAAGQTITVQVRMGNAPLVFFCKYHKGVGMYGALLPPGTASHCCCSSASGCHGMPGMALPSSSGI